MGILDKVLQKLQTLRLERTSAISGSCVNEYDEGFVTGVEAAEAIIFKEKQEMKQGHGLWYTGSPNDIKPNNRGTYILIMRAGFDAEDDEIEKGKVYIDTDFWNGEDWESFETGEGQWEVLYFAKLKWIHFPLPSELGIKWSDDLFFN